MLLVGGTKLIALRRKRLLLPLVRRLSLLIVALVFWLRLHAAVGRLARIMH